MLLNRVAVPSLKRGHYGRAMCGESNTVRGQLFFLQHLSPSRVVTFRRDVCNLAGVRCGCYRGGMAKFGGMTKQEATKKIGKAHVIIGEVLLGLYDSEYPDVEEESETAIASALLDLRDDLDSLHDQLQEAAKLEAKAAQAGK